MLSVTNLLGFLEFLLTCGLSPRVISNYSSAIQSYLSVYQVPVAWMQSSLVSNYLRALHIQVPTTKKLKSTLQLADFLHISQTLNCFDNHQVYRVAFMMAFYGFLRISNLVAPTRTSFDCDRQLCFRDVSVTNSGVYVYLRWAKNLQHSDQSHTICLPFMSNPMLYARSGPLECYLPHKNMLLLTLS